MLQLASFRLLLQGKVFPKLRRKSSRLYSSSQSSSQSSEMSTDGTAQCAADDDEEADYVFHIVASTSQNYSLREFQLFHRTGLSRV